MKIQYAIICATFVFLFGCSNKRAIVSQSYVLQGYYFVKGEVRKPGPIKCDEKDKTLTVLISDAGGLTDYAFRKEIQVIYNGTTNYYNFTKILKGDVDPQIQCGALIYVDYIMN